MYATYTTTYEQPTTQQSYNNNFYESKGHTNSSNFGGSSIMSNDSIKTIKATTRTVGIGAWILLGTVVLGAYHMCSDGDFSFLMTLSSMCSAFGMIMLCLQVATSQSFAGISLKSLQLQAGTFFFRFLSTLFHDGYLPLDSSGDFIYRFAEFSALAAACGGLYMAYAKFNRTYEKEKDSFGNFGPTGGDRSIYGAVWLAAPALLLALFVHPSLNNSLWSDVAWTFALYTDAVAVAPQLFMFFKSGGSVAKYTSHYVFALGFGRVLQLGFWAFSYHELSHDGGFAGMFVMLAQMVGAVLMADYFYYYAKSQQKGGGDMILPSAADMV